MTQEEAVAQMVRKFRSPKIVGFGVKITPDGSDAIADMLELIEAQRVAAVNLTNTQRKLIDAQWRLIGSMTVLACIACLTCWMIGAWL